jgi:hypothetical protein
MKTLPIVAAGLVLAFATSTSAQEVPPQPGPQRALLTLQLRGAQRGFTDQVKGVMLEHDNRSWDLLITGAKMKGTYTCEVHSTDRQTLFDIHRAILASSDIQVSCVNGTPSTRGGVLIDLDDPKGGSFILGATRP